LALFYPEQIKDWKSACKKANVWNKHSNKELQKSFKKNIIKYLTFELSRKEKALAETAVLLVLKKYCVLRIYTLNNQLFFIRNHHRS